MDLSEPIPLQMCIPFAGTHLYGIGLSLHRFQSSERRAIHNPFFTFTITLVYFCRQLISMLLMEGMSDRQYLLFGDYGHFLKARYHINLFLNFGFFIPLASQLVHFWHYFNTSRTQPSYLSPFELLSGSVSAQSLGKKLNLNLSN